MRDDKSTDELYELERSLRRRSYRAKQRRKRQIRRNITIMAIAVVLITAISGTAISQFIKSSKAAKVEAARVAAVEAEQARIEKERQEAEVQAKIEADNTLTLVAVGDNILHDHIIETQENNTGTWDFSFLYQHVKDRISQADLAMVNQETVLTADHTKTKGYPCFNTPAEIADALADTGFDIVEQASNHAFDIGTEGVMSTLDYWNTKFPDIKVLGVHRSAEEAAQITVIEKKGFKLAFLNYTYGVNQEPIPEEQNYLIDLFTERKVIDDVERAKTMADYVVVGLHAGEEGKGEISDYTRHMVQTFADAGVDIIIGSHPHVLQKYEVVNGSSGHQTLVYYSLGNFVSTQQSPEFLLGGMAEITIKRDPDTGECRIDDASMRPLYMYYHYDPAEYAVYWLEDCTSQMFDNCDIHQETDADCTQTVIQTRADAVLAESSFTGPIILTK